MNVPTPLLRGDIRKESQFQKLNEMLQYLKTSQLHADNRFVRVEETPSGTILSALRQVTPPPSFGEGYSGYFRVELVEDDTHTVKVSVVDGSDETFPIAGCAYYKGNKVDCRKVTGIQIAAGFLCLCIQDQDDGTYEADYEIKTAIPENPVADDGTAWYPLAEIIGPDEEGGWYTRQIHQGGVPGVAAVEKEYVGPFSVSYNPTTRIASVAGGWCMINITSFMLAETTLPVTSPGYIVLNSEYSGSAPGTPSYSFETAVPAPEYKKIHIPIARFSTGSGILLLTQFQHGNLIVPMWSDCEDI